MCFPLSVSLCLVLCVSVCCVCSLSPFCSLYRCLVTWMLRCAWGRCVQSLYCAYSSFLSLSVSAALVLFTSTPRFAPQRQRLEIPPSPLPLSSLTNSTRLTVGRSRCRPPSRRPLPLLSPPPPSRTLKLSWMMASSSVCGRWRANHGRFKPCRCVCVCVCVHVHVSKVRARW